MNLTFQYDPLTFLAPDALWHAYVKYLWNYQPASWVARIAYTFRILAFLLLLPPIVLALLDITSYVIARTLGIVDDVKASTSDTKQHLPAPAILVSTPTSGADAAGHGEEAPAAYFALEEQSMKLAGVGVFSPAASRPSSPTIPRRRLAEETDQHDTGPGVLRQRAKQQTETGGQGPVE